MLCDIEINVHGRCFYARARSGTIFQGRLVSAGEVTLLYEDPSSMWFVIKNFEVGSNKEAEIAVIQALQRFKESCAKQMVGEHRLGGRFFNDADWEFDRVEINKYSWNLNCAGEREFTHHDLFTL